MSRATFVKLNDVYHLFVNGRDTHNVINIRNVNNWVSMSLNMSDSELKIPLMRVFKSVYHNVPSHMMVDSKQHIYTLLLTKEDYNDVIDIINSFKTRFSS